MNKKTRTWILVADSARARVVAWNGPDQAVTQVDGFDLRAPHLKSSDVSSDRPGHIQESAGEVRHAHQPHSDPVRVSEKRFAKRVTAELMEHFEAKAFDRLILVAGPTMLGDLRDEIPKPLQAIVRSELAKDLTHQTNETLKETLESAGIL